MQVRIRGEALADYHAIAKVNALAFESAEEPALVGVLRQSSGFDAQLSLVAKVDGQLIGHALFTIYQMRLGGAAVRAAALAPLAVHPLWQRRGVGMRLLE
ncbi:MAG: GNAT family N-acetyltransferase [Anaerolineae bacterium]